MSLRSRAKHGHRNALGSKERQSHISQLIASSNQFGRTPTQWKVGACDFTATLTLGLGILNALLGTRAVASPGAWASPPVESCSAHRLRPGPAWDAFR